MNHSRILIVIALGVMLPLMSAAQQANPAPQASAASSDRLEEVVVTGTRKTGVSVTESLSPIDIVSGSAIANQASSDLTEALRNIAPSFNTLRYPIADGTAFIRPVSLRNLAPDQTLILMNGSRRHRSALVNLQAAPLGTINQGSQAVDWASFPAAAVKHVEVLRDGASALYGSDAIAGVVNIILKDARSGGSLTAQAGQYGVGTGTSEDSDGARVTVTGNVGLPLTASGFLNLTGEYTTSKKTWRGVARPDAVYIGTVVGADLVPLRGLGQRWGDPDVKAIKFLANAGIDITDKSQIYATASYMSNKTVSDFFYRRPVLPTAAEQLNASARGTLQIDLVGGPLDKNGKPTPDGIPDDAPQSIVDGIVNSGLNPADYLEAHGGSPSGYWLRNPIYTKFPGGYNPTFGADMKDFDLTAGVKGHVSDTLSWDTHARYGENKVEYTLGNSINPSLGRLSPTSFHPGTLTQDESGLNADFVKTFTGSPLTVAFGAEFRNETYKIGLGDLPSREVGPATIFGVGSDGFQGFPDQSAGSFKSNSYAGYVDIESDLSDKWTGAVALRYENYQKFNSQATWKLATRYAVTPDFAIRATVNTGFRAPTPGQVNTLNVTTSASQTGELILNGTYPVDNLVAVTLGSKPLKPETSSSFTAGLVWTMGPGVSATLDYYHIIVEDRLVIRNHLVSAQDAALLGTAGVLNADLLVGSSANYFINGFDSKIEGIDLAITARMNVGGGELVLDLRHNHNEQTISNVQPSTINASNVYDLEHQVPHENTVISADFTRGAFGAVVRLNNYGNWKTSAGQLGPQDGTDQYSYNGAALVDLEARYTFSKHYLLAVGAENAFDVKPDLEQDGTAAFLGNKYALTSPFGVNGAFWYGRVGFSY
jgi:iron complex outermembrane receptor protein